MAQQSEKSPTLKNDPFLNSFVKPIYDLSFFSIDPLNNFFDNASNNCLFGATLRDIRHRFLVKKMECL